MLDLVAPSVLRHFLDQLSVAGSFVTSDYSPVHGLSNGFRLAGASHFWRRIIRKYRCIDSILIRIATVPCSRAINVKIAGARALTGRATCLISPLPVIDVALSVQFERLAGLHAAHRLAWSLFRSVSQAESIASVRRHEPCGGVRRHGSGPVETALPVPVYGFQRERNRASTQQDSCFTTVGGLGA